MELTQEQIVEQLRTRGFEAGGFRNPLRHFRGTLTKIRGTMEKFGNMTEARMQVHYDFQSGDLEVIKSTEPYPMPVAQISIWHSNSPTSAMGVLGKSIDKIINAGMDENLPQDKVRNQHFLVGKVQEWMVTPGHPVYNKDANAAIPTDCWEVVMVEGIGEGNLVGVEGVAKSANEVSPAQCAIDILNGRTIQQFNTEVLQNILIKEKGGQLISLIIDGTFVKSLETAGTVTKDENGVYHKVG